MSGLLAVTQDIRSQIAIEEQQRAVHGKGTHPCQIRRKWERIASISLAHRRHYQRGTSTGQRHTRQGLAPGRADMSPSEARRVLYSPVCVSENGSATTWDSSSWTI